MRRVCRHAPWTTERAHPSVRLFALLGAAAASFACAAAPRLDPLAEPAQPSPRASTGVLLAVVRAGTRLVAAGERGTVLLSDDEGASWRQARVPTSVTLTALAFPTPRAGWAVGHGGVVLHSADGGATWTRQLDGVDEARLELAAAQADGAAARLRDARAAVEEGADRPLLDVWFASEASGVVVGAYGAAFRTDDGGRTWSSLRGALDNPRGKHLYAARSDGRALWIAGEQGALYRSDDGGRTFAGVASPYAGTWFGVVPAAGGELVAYGLRGNVYRSADRGANWTKVDTGQPVTVTAGAALADGRVALADESGRVLVGPADAASLRPLPAAQAFSFTGLVQRRDGDLVLTGVRGATRLALPRTTLAAQP